MSTLFWCLRHLGATASQLPGSRKLVENSSTWLWASSWFSRRTALSSVSQVGAPSPVGASAHTASAFIWSSSSFSWTVISTFWNAILLLAVSLHPLHFPHCSPSKHYKKQSEAALPGSLMVCLGGVFTAVIIHGHFPCVGWFSGDSTSLVPENKDD